MTDLPPFADRLTRHQYRETFGRYADKAMQDHAEREGHVPPGVGPVSVSRFGENSRTVVWEWVTGEDSTGQLKELWFADGPWVGQQPRMIAADIAKGEQVMFQKFDSVNKLDPNDTSPVSVTYEVNQREDGIWFGRWVR